MSVTSMRTSKPGNTVSASRPVTRTCCLGANPGLSGDADVDAAGAILNREALIEGARANAPEGTVTEPSTVTIVPSGRLRASAIEIVFGDGGAEYAASGG